MCGAEAEVITRTYDYNTYALAYEVTDMLIDFDLRWTNNTLVEKQENTASTIGSTGKRSEWLMNSAKKWTPCTDTTISLKVKEVLVEKDEETDITVFLSSTDPEAED